MTIKNLSAKDELTIESIAEKLMDDFKYCKINKGDLYIICYNASKLFLCAQQDEKNMFSSPMQVLENLSLFEIANALKGDVAKDDTEYAINENFPYMKGLEDE